ncbi:MAG: TadE family type IV pilus minor pilin [Saccharomonospora viridis]|uniref:TadE family type IV pilus minor pilin n=1 Tax=Saccharomonospora viridis TaxID=1852 RepID=UPI0001A37B90|nr:hypothetical protein SAMN02982918_2886 [Saccharomonospora viridis]
MEAAIGLCALVAVFAFVLAGVMAAVDQLRCTDAAAQAARALARGEPEVGAKRLVDALAPAGSTMTVNLSGDTVLVRVSARSVLPGVTPQAEAQARLEPGVERGSGSAAA